MGLTGRQIGEGPVAQDFGLEGAMKAFRLALRLRMVGPAMDDPHAQAQQPDGQRMTAAPRQQREVALEVHLPQVIGHWTLKA